MGASLLEMGSGASDTNKFCYCCCLVVSAFFSSFHLHSHRHQEWYFVNIGSPFFSSPIEKANIFIFKFSLLIWNLFFNFFFSSFSCDLKFFFGTVVYFLLFSPPCDWETNIGACWGEWSLVGGDREKETTNKKSRLAAFIRPEPSRSTSTSHTSLRSTKRFEK